MTGKPQKLDWNLIPSIPHTSRAYAINSLSIFFACPLVLSLSLSLLVSLPLSYHETYSLTKALSVPLPFRPMLVSLLFPEQVGKKSKSESE